MIEIEIETDGLGDILEEAVAIGGACSISALAACAAVTTISSYAPASNAAPLTACGRTTYATLASIAAISCPVDSNREAS